MNGLVGLWSMITESTKEALTEPQIVSSEITALMALIYYHVNGVYILDKCIGFLEYVLILKNIKVRECERR
jgi:hypothetical protein